MNPILVAAVGAGLYFSGVGLVKVSKKAVGTTGHVVKQIVVGKHQHKKK